jgi:DNA mismatch endonuclease (patch repair protein)
LVFPRLGKIILVHGCFWHQHPGCGRQPKSHLGFWTKKLSQNRERDLRNQRKLRFQGWRILIVWECVFAGAVTTVFNPTALSS